MQKKKENMLSDKNHHFNLICLCKLSKKLLYLKEEYNYYILIILLLFSYSVYRLDKY